MLLEIGGMGKEKLCNEEYMVLQHCTKQVLEEGVNIVNDLNCRFS